MGGGSQERGGEELRCFTGSGTAAKFRDFVLSPFAISKTTAEGKRGGPVACREAGKFQFLCGQREPPRHVPARVPGPVRHKLHTGSKLRSYRFARDAH